MPSIGTRTRASVASSAPGAQYFPRRLVDAPASLPPFAAAFDGLAGARAVLSTQPAAFSSLAHTGSFDAFALLIPEPFRFVASYIKRESS